jgi:hypothetical protein
MDREAHRWADLGRCRTMLQLERDVKPNLAAIFHWADVIAKCRVLLA